MPASGVYAEVPFTADTMAAGTGGFRPDSLVAADTLGSVAAGSHGNLAGSGALSTDSLPAHIISDASQIFGEQSYPLAADLHTMAGIAGDTGVYGHSCLTSGSAYSVIVLLAFVAFCSLCFGFRSHLVSLFGVIRGSVAMEKVYGNQNFVLELFLRLLLLLGTLMLGVTIVKYVDIYSGDYVCERLPYWAIPLLPVFTGAAFYLVGVLQRFMLAVCGALTRNTGFTSGLIRLRKLLIVLSMALLLPFTFLFCLSAQTDKNVLGIGILAVLVLQLLFFLFKTYQFFIAQKVSILYWFLYLCTVEFFPISLLVLLAVRSI